jgi:hypothetical protein
MRKSYKILRERPEWKLPIGIAGILSHSLILHLQIIRAMHSNIQKMLNSCHVVYVIYLVPCWLNLMIQRDTRASIESRCQKHGSRILCRHNKQNNSATRGKCQFHSYRCCLCWWWYNSHSVIYSTNNTDAATFYIFVLCVLIDTTVIILCFKHE